MNDRASQPGGFDSAFSLATSWLHCVNVKAGCPNRQVVRRAELFCGDRNLFAFLPQMEADFGDRTANESEEASEHPRPVVANKLNRIVHSANIHFSARVLQ